MQIESDQEYFPHIYVASFIKNKIRVYLCINALLFATTSLTLFWKLINSHYNIFLLFFGYSLNENESVESDCLVL